MAPALPAPTASSSPPLLLLQLQRRYVSWQEENVCSEKGSRVVHYYLKDRHGDLTLAVVGSEKSLRHMVYTVSDKFARSVAKKPAAMKWRSRRDVVDWLSSLVSQPAVPGCPYSASAKPITGKRIRYSDSDSSNDSSIKRKKFKCPDELRISGVASRGFSWLGPSLICKKFLLHYRSFCYNDLIVSVNSFTYFTFEGEQRIAYIEDMFEDSNGKKSIRVRWFQKNTETLHHLSCHEKELFLTSYHQVLDAATVEGLATVLNRENFEECIAKLPPVATTHVYLCCRQFVNDAIKLFDISQLEGYWSQKVFSSIHMPLSCRSSLKWNTMKELQMENVCEFNNSLGQRLRKSRRSRRYNAHEQYGAREYTFDVMNNSSKFSNLDRVRVLNNSTKYQKPSNQSSRKRITTCEKQHLISFDIGDEVEILSQDSGIRGCWFKGEVMSKELGTVKVRYRDLLNDDESDKLEEWIQPRVADDDKLGIRISGRLTVRPSPPQEMPIKTDVGTPVDAWWNDGWWEGVVVQLDESIPKFHVYFQGEDEVSVFELKDLRPSRDWVNNQWNSLKVVPNIAASVISLEVETMYGRRTPSSVLDEVTGSVSYDSKSSPSSLTLTRQCSGAERSVSHTKDLELKEDVVLDSGSSEREHHVYDLAKDEVLAKLKWCCSRKRKSTRDAGTHLHIRSSGLRKLSNLFSKASVNDDFSNGAHMPEFKRDLLNKDEKDEAILQERTLKQGQKSLNRTHGDPLGSSLCRSNLPLTNHGLAR